MASSVIHMCVAKEINKTIKMDENMLLLGSIAPDLSKHVGETKLRSHFLNEDNTVNIDKFLDKYKTALNNPFMMGYFIHLYTDLLWDKYFMSDIIENDTIILLNGEKIPRTKEKYRELIYQDYTNLNIDLLDIYNLDLSLFYNEVNLPEGVFMDEIPIEKLKLLIDHTGVIIENTKKEKAYTFKMNNIIPFIELSTKLILSVINEI